MREIIIGIIAVSILSMAFVFTLSHFGIIKNPKIYHNNGFMYIKTCIDGHEFIAGDRTIAANIDDNGRPIKCAR
jgi:hypothetical protein